MGQMMTDDCDNLDEHTSRRQADADAEYEDREKMHMLDGVQAHNAIEARERAEGERDAAIRRAEKAEGLLREWLETEVVRRGDERVAEVASRTSIYLVLRAAREEEQ